MAAFTSQSAELWTPNLLATSCDVSRPWKQIKVEKKHINEHKPVKLKKKHFPICPLSFPQGSPGLKNPLQRPSRRHSPWATCGCRRASPRPQFLALHRQWKIHRIGSRENLQETPIFHGESHGFHWFMPQNSKKQQKDMKQDPHSVKMMWKCHEMS